MSPRYGVETTSTGRVVRVVQRQVNQETLQSWLMLGEQSRRERWEAATYDQYEDVLLRFESLVEAAQKVGMRWDMGQQLCAFAGYMLARAGRGRNKAQTAEQALRNLVDALRFFRGIRVEGTVWEDLRRGLQKGFSPTVKANPLEMDQLVSLGRRLPPREGAFVALMWMTTQRAANLRLIRSVDSWLTKEGDEELLYLWLTQRIKNKTLDEQLRPRVQKLVLGVLADPVRVWWGKVMEERIERPFEGLNLDLITVALRDVPTRQNHPLLKKAYTLYSVRRGALQLAAMCGLPMDLIQTLSLHKRLSTLSIYVGSFLDPRVADSAQVSRVLTRVPPGRLPPEFPMNTMQDEVPRRRAQSEERTPSRRTHTEERTPGQRGQGEAGIPREWDAFFTEMPGDQREVRQGLPQPRARMTTRSMRQRMEDPSPFKKLT